MYMYNCLINFVPPPYLVGMGDPVGDGFHASDCGDWLLRPESEKGTLLLHMTSTLSASAVWVKAPSSQSLTRLRTLQKLGLGDLDLARGPENSDFRRYRTIYIPSV